MPGLKWVQIGIGFAVGFALCWLIHMVILSDVDSAHRTAMADQKVALDNQCAADAAITKGRNDALQRDFNSVASKLADAKRLHPSTCLVPTPSGEADIPDVQRGHAGQNGIGTDWLRDYGALCANIQKAYGNATGFIDDVWTSRGQ